MSSMLLARRYLAYNRLRTGILVACIALVAFLPFAVELLIRHYQESLESRARDTPLLVGAKGSRYDLLLNTLYFRGDITETLPVSEADKIHEDRLGTAIPFYIQHTVQQRRYPVVGTTLDYFDFRELETEEGTLPLILGDVVVGASIAREHGIHAGDKLLTDTEKLYDISSSYPLRMRVSGILKPRNTPDDWAVFVDIRTAWIIDGIGHGHQDPVDDPKVILKKEDGHVAANAALVEFQEITPENIDSFHFHGDRGDYPATAILVIPHDQKTRTILLGRLNVSTTVQPLIPSVVLSDMMEVVFRVKRFFDVNLALVSLATALFLTLVVLLTLRVRQRELETLFKIGCSKRKVFQIQATELALVIGAGFLVAGIGAGALYWWAQQGPLPI